MSTTLIYNAIIPGTDADSWVIFDEDTILETGDGNAPHADTRIDARGMLLLPGAIDAHVHFREPGLTHKATIATESRAAKAGGVTTFFDMPNTVPQTVNMETVRQKLETAARTSAVNYAFFIGATNTNIPEILEADFSIIPGIKLFMGSSTGNMLVDNGTALDALFANAKVPIVVHAEDEEIVKAGKAAAINRYGNNVPVAEHSNIRSRRACIRATERAIGLCRRHPAAHLHIAHVSTAEEVEMIAAAKAAGLNVTAEVSPHHLLFTADDYPRLGTRIKMNPAVKTRHDRDALRQGVIDGTIDIIATDHAPHTLAEKQGDALTAVSGAPMVQFSLIAMLDLFPVQTVIKAMMENPAGIFRVDRRGKIAPGMFPDMVMVKEVNPYTVTDADVLSLCGWTPLAGTILRHKVEKVFVTPRPVHFQR